MSETEKPRDNRAPETTLKRKLARKKDQAEFATTWERGYSQNGANDGHAWSRNTLVENNVHPKVAKRVAEDDSHAFETDAAPRKAPEEPAKKR